MIIGFSLIGFGLLKTYQRPSDLGISIVRSASGILVSFLGGSFLLVYRSVLTQTKGYVSVLERINAVGMAVQVIGTISAGSEDLKNEATVGLARQLVELYTENSLENAGPVAE